MPADLAVTLAGGATTTVYPSTNADDVAYILIDCAATVVFAEDAGQLAKIRTGDCFVGAVHTVVMLDESDPEIDGVLPLSELATVGRGLLARFPSTIEDTLGRLTPQSLATVVYTSGTTGRPKGVELTHESWLYIGRCRRGGRDPRRPVSRRQRLHLALADRLVFSKIRDRFAGNLEYLVSGSAALSPQIAEWFAAAGLPILERVLTVVNAHTTLATSRNSAASSHL